MDDGKLFVHYQNPLNIGFKGNMGGRKGVKTLVFTTERQFNQTETAGKAFLGECRQNEMFTLARGQQLVNTRKKRETLPNSTGFCGVESEANQREKTFSPIYTPSPNQKEGEMGAGRP
ncbi:MAG: hypothetical protein AAB581_03300 [Patescibacteria group bacterium]